MFCVFLPCNLVDSSEQKKTVLWGFCLSFLKSFATNLCREATGIYCPEGAIVYRAPKIYVRASVDTYIHPWDVTKSADGGYRNLKLS